MFEVEKNGLLPLSKESLATNVPARAGVYMLSTASADGVTHLFFASYTENLFNSLWRLVHHDYTHIPAEHTHYFGIQRCFFSYFVIVGTEYREDVEKILTQTVDPIQRLRIVNCS